MKHLFLLLFFGCGSAPERPSDDAEYAAAERALSRGELDEAGTLFARLADTPDAERRAFYRYRQATVARRAGRDEEAQRLLAEVAAGPAPERAALAAFQQAVEVFEQAGDDRRLRALVDEAPDTVAADKAVKFIATHATTPEAAAAASTWLVAIAERHPQAAVADNALWWAAELQLLRLANLPGARALLRRLATAFPESPLTDDAIWRLAQIHLRQGQWQEAEQTLASLLQIRNETSYFVGSYRSPHLDDAALLIARIRYDGLRDPQGAARACETLLREFPTSVLVDDALLELAHSHFAAQRPQPAQAALERLLREFPDSRHAATARALATQATPRPPNALRTEPFVAVSP